MRRAEQSIEVARCVEAADTSSAARAHAAPGPLSLGRAELRTVVSDLARRLGDGPIDREFEQLGYDIEDRASGTGRLRLIEVKGRIEGAATTTVITNAIPTSSNKLEEVTLALIEFGSSERYRLRYLRHPFERNGISRDFNGSSVSFPLAGLLQRASEPS